MRSCVGLHPLLALGFTFFPVTFVLFDAESGVVFLPGALLLVGDGELAPVTCAEFADLPAFFEHMTSRIELRDPSEALGWFCEIGISKKFDYSVDKLSFQQLTF